VSADVRSTRVRSASAPQEVRIPRRGKALCVLALLAGTAYADRVVALAPLSSAGSEDKSAATKQLTKSIEQALVALGDVKVIDASATAAAADRAKKPQLKLCEDDVACLADLGKLVGAQLVVSGDVGGLGESRVVYLTATDVSAQRLVRSTTLAVGAKGVDPATAQGAAVRLLDPDKYTGTIRLAIDVPNANVFVNGSRVTPSAKGELVLPVGTQAIRVTNPEYHDFVRFVDVTYGKPVDVAVGMQQYPIIEKNVRGAPTSRDKVEYIDPPLWRRWYVTGPVAAALAITVGVIWYERAQPGCNKCVVIGGQTTCSC
jgi:hypothetical protein